MCCLYTRIRTTRYHYGVKLLLFRADDEHGDMQRFRRWYDDRVERHCTTVCVIMGGGDGTGCCLPCHHSYIPQHAGPLGTQHCRGCAEPGVRVWSLCMDRVYKSMKPPCNTHGPACRPQRRHPSYGQCVTAKQYHPGSPASCTLWLADAPAGATHAALHPPLPRAWKAAACIAANVHD